MCPIFILFRSSRRQGLQYQKNKNNLTFGSKDMIHIKLKNKLKKDGWVCSKITLFTAKVPSTHLRLGHKLLVPTCHRCQTLDGQLYVKGIIE